MMMMNNIGNDSSNIKGGKKMNCFSALIMIVVGVLFIVMGGAIFGDEWSKRHPTVIDESYGAEPTKKTMFVKGRLEWMPTNHRVSMYYGGKIIELKTEDPKEEKNDK
jgi:hypothetical protein